jgi:hypothetical protein
MLFVGVVGKERWMFAFVVVCLFVVVGFEVGRARWF